MSREALTRAALAGALLAAVAAVLAIVTEWGSWERDALPFGVLALALGVAALIRLLTRSERRGAAVAEALRGRDERTALILDRSHEAYIAMDESGRAFAWNSSAETMFGWQAAEAIGRPVADLIIPPDMRERHWQGLTRFLETGEARVIGPRTELTALHRDGSEIPVELSITAIEDDGKHTFHGFVRDITERKLLEAQQQDMLTRAEHTARMDPLTELPNRRHWDEELGRELARARRTKQTLCVALIDLDHFKSYNDSRGHQAGDRLLRRSASAWRLAVRASDFVARYGGEEFAVLLPDCPLDEAITVIERLRAETPDGQTVSAGLAQWNGYESEEALIDRADLALYKAKRAGRDRSVTAA